MRKIKTFEHISQAQQARHLLTAKGIETRSEEEDPTSIWVLSDTDLARARALVEQFINSPDQYMTDIAAGAREQDIKHQAAQRRAAEQEKLTRLLRKTGTPVTLALIIICTLLFILTLFEPMRIVKYVLMFPRVYHLSEIPAWQYWRLVTPIFLHGGIFHIMFNMMWVYSLGPLIERRLSTTSMISLIIMTGLISNVAFFLIASPNFLGMSGVIYGFIGFLWANDRISPTPQLTLDPGTFKFFMIWYVICWVLSGLGIMPIANTIHGLGGLMGILFGFFANGYWKKIALSNLLDKNSRYTLGLVIAMAAGGVIVDYVVYS